MNQVIKQIRVVKPAGRHKSFRILIRSESKWTAYKSDALNTINAELKSNHLTLTEAEIRVRQIADFLRLKRLSGDGRQVPVMCSRNAQVLDRYLKARYTPSKLARMEPKSYASQVSYLKQALGYLGNTPIDTEVEVIQERLDTVLASNHRKHKRMCTVLNSILMWQGYQGRLQPFPEQMWEVTYISEDELGGVLRRISSPNLQIAAAVAFWTGLRLGELCAIQPQDVKGNHLHVHSQIDDNLNRRRCKNRKSRIVYLEPLAIEWVNKWLEIPTEDRMRFRLTRPSDGLKEACRKELGRSDIVFHSLRHSRAVYLIGKGAPIELVAQNLGNSPTVCEKHYYGHRLSSAGSAYLEQLLVGDSR